MPFPLPRALLAAALLAASLAFCSPAWAQAASTDADTPVSRADSIFSTEYLRQLWHDTGAVLTEPVRWDDTNWEIAGAWTGATLTAAAFDHRIRTQAQAHWQSRGDTRFFKDWQNLGAQYSFIEIAAFEGWGVAAHDPEARNTAMDALTASIIAGGIITPTIKYAVGRYRPIQTSRTFRFRPFSGHQSFPSGHATQAFAIATVVASHYTAWWEQTLSYGAAALVDVARVQQNRHFASDVIAGSAIGWAVGKAVVHRHTLPGQVEVAPWFGDGFGLMVSKDF